MIQIPSAVMFAALLLIGPFAFRHEISTVILFGLMASAVTVVLVSKRSSRRQSMALLFLLSILFYESLQLITRWLSIELIKEPMFGGREAVHLASSFFFDINAGLAIIGAAAAGIVAVYLQVRKTYFPLAKLFPEMSFVTAPTELLRSVAEISETAGITPPALSLIDSGEPAAFITRTSRGFELAVSVGLLESLSQEELIACIAHEISHVKNNDFAVRSFATSARVALFAHPLSHLIEPALYRAREFLADKTAAQLVGGRGSLISALAKIRESQGYITSQTVSISTPCLFHPPSRSRFVRLFDKHPGLDARIKALKELNSLE